MKPLSEIETQTIRYYDEHAEEHADRTASAEMLPFYTLFLEAIPRGGAILDAGCGSGRATKFFVEHGYQVTAIDASPGYAAEAHKRTGLRVRVLRFQDLDYQSAFDGVWASASLLHVPRAQLVGVLNLVANALKPGGIIQLSLKYGTEERLDEKNRYFNDMNERTFREKVSNTASLHVVKLWVTDSVVSGSQKWLNAILALKDSPRVAS